MFRTPNIKALPGSLRPRERLAHVGPHQLHTRELLAIIMGSGAQGLSALDLADKLLSMGGLSNLATMSIPELTSLQGIGEAKASQIKAALELGLRLAASVPDAKPVITCPGDAAALVMGEMRFLDRESFRVILLDTKNHVLEINTVSLGSLDSSPAHPREAYKRAVIRSAASVIFVHNHPSGDPEPSSQDIQLTSRLAQAGDILGIKLLDHIIVGDNRFVSLKEKRGVF